MSQPVNDPTPNFPFALPEVVRAGDLRKSLEAVRDFLAERLVHCDVKDSASVARQLVAVLKELDSLPNPSEVTVSGDLAQQYTHRVTGPEDKQSP